MENQADPTVIPETAQRLLEAMEAFRGLPTDRLVAESILRTSDPETGYRLAGAVAFGFTRSGQYIDTARGLIEQILMNADQVSWHMKAYTVILDRIGDDYNSSPTAIGELDRAVGHSMGAKELSVRSEVHWHLYVICLDRAWFFLSNSARRFDANFQLKVAQDRYIKTIREFRNHLEHRDKAIVNLDSPDWLTMSRDTEDAFEVGYQRDNRNRILFRPTSGDQEGKTLKMPMSKEGFLQFQNVITHTYQKLKQSALDRLVAHFKAYPESIPTPNLVGTLVNDHIELVE